MATFQAFYSILVNGICVASAGQSSMGHSIIILSYCKVFSHGVAVEKYSTNSVVAVTPNYPPI